MTEKNEEGYRRRVASNERRQQPTSRKHGSCAVSDPQRALPAGLPTHLQQEVAINDETYFDLSVRSSRGTHTRTRFSRLLMLFGSTVKRLRSALRFDAKSFKINLK
jgi:hypothetical protein